MVENASLHVSDGEGKIMGKMELSQGRGTVNRPKTLKYFLISMGQSEEPSESRVQERGLPILDRIKTKGLWGQEELCVVKREEGKIY